MSHSPANFSPNGLLSYRRNENRLNRAWNGLGNIRNILWVLRNLDLPMRFYICSGSVVNREVAKHAQGRIPRRIDRQDADVA